MDLKNLKMVPANSSAFMNQMDAHLNAVTYNAYQDVWRGSLTPIHQTPIRHKADYQ